MTYRIHIIWLLLLIDCCVTMAQGKGKFDPAKFEAQLEQFVATEAALTPKESAEFFPLYREMRKKQFSYMGEDRRLRFVDTSDDKACAEAIRRRDDNDMRIKRLQQEYHEKFMRVLSPSKVFRVIKAEDKFHRQLFSRHIKNGGKRHGK